VGVAVPAVALVLWEICSRFAIVSPRYFPAPTTIAWTLADRLVAGDLGTDLLVTLTRLGFAFALAAVPAVPLGLLMGIARPVRDLVEPYLAFIFPVPKIALLPFLMIILGVGEPAFVLTGASSAFFQIVISTLGGVQSLDPRLLEAGRNYGAHGARLFRKVILPAALPSIFTGLRLGLGLAWFVIVVGEMTGVPQGLGAVIMDARTLSRTDLVICGMIVIGLAGYLSDRVVVMIGNRLLRWSPSHHG